MGRAWQSFKYVAEQAVPVLWLAVRSRTAGVVVPRAPVFDCVRFDCHESHRRWPIFGEARGGTGGLTNGTVTSAAARGTRIAFWEGFDPVGSGGGGGKAGWATAGR